jgi:hypothetical protein
MEGSKAAKAARIDRSPLRSISKLAPMVVPGGIRSAEGESQGPAAAATQAMDPWRLGDDKVVARWPAGLAHSAKVT